VTDAVRPVLLVVSRSAKVRDLLREELLHRYDRDYDVVTAGSPDEARERLAGDGQAAGGQAPVALLLAGLGGEDPDGLDVIARLADVSGSALRVHAIRWGDWSTAEPIFEAVTLGRIDRWIYWPESRPDEDFLPLPLAPVGMASPRSMSALVALDISWSRNRDTWRVLREASDNPFLFASSSSSTTIGR